MPDPLRIAYFAHTLRSDWNNGNAHFLRGLVRALIAQGHQVTVFEQEENWSTQNLLSEGELGAQSLAHFDQTYPEISIQHYTLDPQSLGAHLRDTDIVIVHEWNSPELIGLLLNVRDELHFRTLFHDTHHRASSTPESIKLLQVWRFDGVLVFGAALRAIYLQRFGLEHVWTLHEAADTTIFHPAATPITTPEQDVVWIGNWGDDERAAEIKQFLLDPAVHLRDQARFAIHGVRYPETALTALNQAGVRYAGYLPNLQAPRAYASSRITLHIPRQLYSGAMAGIPTIRVFEALAAGIPLISAPWHDVERLFSEGDFLVAENTAEMTAHIRHLLDNPADAQAQADRGLSTVLAHHTCSHRAEQLAGICHEVLAQ